jgi:hypothetical protein
LTFISRFQFNLYSNIHLFILPLFIVIAHRWLRVGKFHEFIITRFYDRQKYIASRNASALAFVLIYHLGELAVTVAVFAVSRITYVGHFRIVGFSDVIKNIFCITPQTAFDSIVIIMFTQIMIIFLYLVFTQIIILSELHISIASITVGVPLMMNFVLLVLVKTDFWFDKSIFRHLLPHRNLALGYLFSGSNENYNLHKMLIAIVYWLCILSAVYVITAKTTNKKDFIFLTSTAEREME